MITGRGVTTICLINPDGSAVEGEQNFTLRADPGNPALLGAPTDVQNVGDELNTRCRRVLDGVVSGSTGVGSARGN